MWAKGMCGGPGGGRPGLVDNELGLRGYKEGL
jgi:hypothetical protein